MPFLCNVAIGIVDFGFGIILLEDFYLYLPQKSGDNVKEPPQILLFAVNKAHI
jgi:hypothetical protein